jgi:hypothetical protein
MSEARGNLDAILKAGDILLGGFGVISGLVRWFIPYFSIAHFMSGTIVIALSLFILALQLSQINIVQYTQFVRHGWGKALLFVVIGMHFADTQLFWITCWVLFSFWGVVWIGADFVKSDGTGGLSGGQDGAPEVRPLNEGYDGYVLK